MKIIIPLGGEGKAFKDRGHTFPKPLIEIAGKPMIEIVIHNLIPHEPHEFVFICQRDHLNKYALGDVLRLIAPNCKIVEMQDQTMGALCSVLLGSEHILRDKELLIANGDQYLDVHVDAFLKESRRSHADGCIMTFPSTHPKWSYLKLDQLGEVVAVAEKRPISRHATVGLYYFRKGGDFLDGAERMILKHCVVGGQFFVCPVYNELVLAGKRTIVYPINKENMHSLGTPDDVELFATSSAQNINWA